MARRFAKVSEEEIEETFFYPSDLVNTKTTIPLSFASGIYPPSGDSCILDQGTVTYTTTEFLPLLCSWEEITVFTSFS